MIDKSIIEVFMPVPRQISSIKRFGPRYGNITKQKFGMIESMQRQAYKCASCSKMAVKRLAAGIWHCQKCGIKFTGKAYTVTKKKSIKELIVEVAGVKKESEETYKEEQ